jgi:DNA-binding NtrC family response regulator
VVDDEANIRESLRDWLKDIGYEVSIAGDGQKALEIAARDVPDIVITDLVMPGTDGIELTRRLKETCPDTDIVLITAFASVPTAIEAIRAGAYDYVEKPFCPERLELVIKKIIEHQDIVRENFSLRQKLDSQYRFENIIAKSHRMQEVFEVVRVVAKSNATVLVTGESGTGKELIARAIHNLSQRRGKPFVAVSCAALPESLLESELFGHERGAFTGATSQKKGKFEYAHTGTLFLDEIGDISPNVQVHLLRVIEEKEFNRVGGNEPIKVDVRIISATNRDLKAGMEKGQFREDLYYRLNVVAIHLPPLRERREDIPPLAEHFLRKFAMENHKEIKDFSPDANELMMKYEWPGNIRELENAIERAVILARGEFITQDELPGIGASLASVDLAGKSLRDLEKECIMGTLRKTGGNISESARILGITRMTLYNKMKEFGLSVNKSDRA